MSLNSYIFRPRLVTKPIVATWMAEHVGVRCVYKLVLYNFLLFWHHYCIYWNNTQIKHPANNAAFSCSA
jgi:hypothetical protein